MNANINFSPSVSLNTLQHGDLGLIQAMEADSKLQPLPYKRASHSGQLKRIALVLEESVNCAFYLKGGSYARTAFKVRDFVAYFRLNTRFSSEAALELVGSCASYIVTGIGKRQRSDHDFRIWLPGGIDKRVTDRFVYEFFQDLLKRQPHLHVLEKAEVAVHASLDGTSLTYQFGLDLNFRSRITSPLSVNSSEGFAVRLPGGELSCLNQMRYCEDEAAFQQAMEDVRKKIYRIDLTYLKNIELRVLRRLTRGYEIYPDDYLSLFASRLQKEYRLRITTDGAQTKLWTGTRDLLGAYHKHLDHAYGPLFSQKAISLPYFLDLFNLLALVDFPALAIVELARVVCATEAPASPLLWLKLYPLQTSILLNFIYGVAICEKQYEPQKSRIGFTSQKNRYLLTTRSKGVPLSVKEIAADFAASAAQIGLLVKENPKIFISLKNLFCYLELPPLDLSQEKIASYLEQLHRLHFDLFVSKDKPADISTPPLRLPHPPQAAFSLPKWGDSAAKPLKKVIAILKERDHSCASQTYGVHHSGWSYLSSAVRQQFLDFSLHSSRSPGLPLKIIPMPHFEEDKAKVCWKLVMPQLHAFTCQTAMAMVVLDNPHLFVQLLQQFSVLYGKKYSLTTQALLLSLTRFLSKNYLKSTSAIVLYPTLYRALSKQIQALYATQRSSACVTALQMQAFLPPSSPAHPSAIQHDCCNNMQAIAEYFFRQKAYPELAVVVGRSQTELSTTHYVRFAKLMGKLAERLHATLFPKTLTISAEDYQAILAALQETWIVYQYRPDLLKETFCTISTSFYSSKESHSQRCEIALKSLAFLDKMEPPTAGCSDFYLLNTLDFLISLAKEHSLPKQREVLEAISERMSLIRTLLSHKRFSSDNFRKVFDIVLKMCNLLARQFILASFIHNEPQIFLNFLKKILLPQIFSFRSFQGTPNLFCAGLDQVAFLCAELPDLIHTIQNIPYLANSSFNVTNKNASKQQRPSLSNVKKFLEKQDCFEILQKKIGVHRSQAKDPFRFLKDAIHFYQLTTSDISVGNTGKKIISSFYRALCEACRTMPSGNKSKKENDAEKVELADTFRLLNQILRQALIRSSMGELITEIKSLSKIIPSELYLMSLLISKKAAEESKKKKSA